MAYQEALDAAADHLETEARRRAVEGVEEPVFGPLGRRLGSGEIGRIRKYSDTLLIFLLKGARPAKFRERFEHTIENRSLAAKLAAATGIPAEDLLEEAAKIVAATTTAATTASASSSTPPPESA